MIPGTTNFWHTDAKHIISASPSDLNLSVRGLGMHWTKRYPLGEVSNLRVGSKRIFTYRPWLAFDREARPGFSAPN